MGNSNHNKKSSEEMNAFQSDGIDVVFSMEKADDDDLEALARSQAADERAKKRK